MVWGEYDLQIPEGLSAKRSAGISRRDQKLIVLKAKRSTQSWVGHTSGDGRKPVRMKPM